MLGTSPDGKAHKQAQLPIPRCLCMLPVSWSFGKCEGIEGKVQAMKIRALAAKELQAGGPGNAPTSSTCLTNTGAAIRSLSAGTDAPASSVHA